MNTSGILLAVVGAWVVCQVFGGNGLVRVGIVKGDSVSVGKKLTP